MIYSLDDTHVSRRLCDYDVSNIAENMSGFEDLTDNGSDGGGLWLKLGGENLIFRDVFDPFVMSSHQ